MCALFDEPCLVGSPRPIWKAERPLGHSQGTQRFRCTFFPKWNLVKALMDLLLAKFVDDRA